MPVIFVLGGSQGAEIINNTILDALPRLVKNYQIIHQTGVKNFKTVSGQAEVVLADNKQKIKISAYFFFKSFANENGGWRGNDYHFSRWLDFI